jgi:3-oxoadipate enol-lactonase
MRASGLRYASIARWFTAEFAAAQAAQANRITAMLAATSAKGYAGNCAAVRGVISASNSVRSSCRS